MNDMKSLLAEAREKGLWVWCSYQDIWFTPDDLEAAQRNGTFRWSPENFRLRDPRERERELVAKIDSRVRELEAFRQRLHEATR